MSEILVMVIVLGGPCAELVALYFLNKAYFVGTPGIGEGGAADEAERVAERSLTFFGFSGTAMAFLLSQLPAHSALGFPVVLLGLSLLLFLVSHRLGVVAATRRGFFEAQTRTQNYGMIAFAFALAFGFRALSPGALWVLVLVPIAALALDFLEFAYDAKDYRRPGGGDSQAAVDNSIVGLRKALETRLDGLRSEV